MTDKRIGSIYYTDDMLILDQTLGNNAFPVLMAINMYTTTGKEPDIEAFDTAQKVAYLFLKQKADINLKKFDEIVKTRKERAQKAAEARWNNARNAKASASNAKDANACTSMNEQCLNANINMNMNMNKNMNIEEEEEERARAKLIDDDWKMVADAYQKQIGMLPMGTALDVLISYVDDLHGETVVKAIEITNKGTPENPYKYLIKILKNFADNGIDSKDKAEAYILDRERRRNNERNRNSGTLWGSSETGKVARGSGTGTGDRADSGTGRGQFSEFAIDLPDSAKEYLASTYI